MPAHVELDWTKEHTTCYVCEKIIQWDKRKSHWNGMHHQLEHGPMDDSQFKAPYPLYVQLQPMDATEFTQSDVPIEHDLEQPLEFKPYEPIQEDEVYPGAGMYAWQCQILIL
jgi:hypothetical protein